MNRDFCAICMPQFLSNQSTDHKGGEDIEDGGFIDSPISSPVVTPISYEVSMTLICRSIPSFLQRVDVASQGSKQWLGIETSLETAPDESAGSVDGTTTANNDYSGCETTSLNIPTEATHYESLISEKTFQESISGSTLYCLHAATTRFKETLLCPSLVDPENCCDFSSEGR